MRAAPHAFAVGVEYQRGDIAKAIGGHCFGQPSLQPLNREARRDLPDKPSGIGKAGLHRHPAPLPGVGTVGRLCQQGIQKPPAMFKRSFGFEQRRDVNLVFHPEQLGEIERGEHRGGLFAFGHQHPDRGISIDVLDDLRHRDELPDRGGAFGGKRGEIGAQRRGFIHHRAQGGERAFAGEFDHFAFGQAAADRVVELFGVHAEMDPAHPQPIGAHRGGERQQGDGAGLRGGIGLGFERGDQRRERQQVVGAVGGQPVGGGGQRCFAAEIACEIGGAFSGEPRRGAQSVEQRVRRVDGFQRGGVARQPFSLFGQAEPDRGVPANIGAPVHVISDPAGKAERQRAQGAPLIGPVLARFIEQAGDNRIARILRPAHRGHCGAVFVVKRHGGVFGRDHAGAIVDHPIARGRSGNRLGLFRREQEGGVRGEHGVELRAFPARARAFPARAKGVEIAILTRQCGGAFGGWSQQLAQLGRAGFQPVAFQISHQRGQIIQAHLPRLKPARQIERQLKHRVEQRGFAGALMQVSQPCFKIGDGLHGDSPCSVAKAAAAPNRPGCGWTISLTGMPAIRLSNRPLDLNLAAKPDASSVSRMR